MPTPPERAFPTASKALAALIAAVLLVAMLVVVPSPRAAAAELPPSILEGGYIISDNAFFDGDSMTASQIQSFLNARVPTCKSTSSSLPCLKSFKAKLPSKAADRYCKAVSGKTSATAAEIIARVSVACGISPKVIITMLQKEQGLVTSTAPSSWAYRASMGQSCPDTAPCDAAAAGFVNQVYLGARQFQVYTQNPGWYNYRPGQVNTIKWHPNSDCGTSKVYIQNRATANLYIYTPYRPNVAALSAGYGTGDKCSSYGNRNFYNYYVDWFEPDASASTGAPAQTAACQKPLGADIASRSGTATVTINDLNVRTAPTLKCSSGMIQLDKGASVTVTGAYGAWTRATVSGKTMWMYSSYLKSSVVGAPAGGSSSCPTPAESSVAAATGTLAVTTSTLNARQAPATSCTTGVIQLKQGTKITRTGTYGEWVRITHSGATRWVHGDYVTVVDAAPPACATPSSGTSGASGTYIIRSSGVKARTAPSSKCADGASWIGYGTAMTRTGTNGTWTRVTSGGDTWWVGSAYIKPAPTIYTTGVVFFRDSPSTAGAMISKVPKGTAITRLGAHGDWRKVIVGSKTGYVHGNYVSTRKPAASTKKTAYATAGVYVRASATTSSRILTILPRGTKVTITGTSGVWRKVTAGGHVGWVHSNYLK